VAQQGRRIRENAGAKAPCRCDHEAIPLCQRERSGSPRQPFAKGLGLCQCGRSYTDEPLADMYPAQAVVTVMQLMDDLSDEQAAAAGRARSAWPAGLSLELSAAGFEAAVLSDCRPRLVVHEAGPRRLDGGLSQVKTKLPITLSARVRAMLI
jgi:hypothetical protein